MQRPTTLSSNDIHDQQDPLEDHPLFTPDLEYFTAPTGISLDNTNAYSLRTLTPYNLVRLTILPCFPPSSSMVVTYNSSDSPNNDTIHLLLCNAPEQQLSQLQLARRQPGAYLLPFDLTEKKLEITDGINDSFLISVYRQILYDLSIKWNISMSLLDYNLVRLRQCAKACLEQWQQQQRQEQLQLIPRLPTTATFSMEELPLALEFYLQIDVDLFYFKTCWFRQAKPIEETVFCSKLPEVHYTLTACNKSPCTCCHPVHTRINSGQKKAVLFDTRERHQFVNDYRAILNCPATCETANIIYVLTCPCEQFDYVGATTLSFRDCLTEHRHESNRILQEFIFGPTITKHLSRGIKSAETRRNDSMWLYQHAARCPMAIQLFLDANPDYWCFTPKSHHEVYLPIINTTTSQQSTSNRIDADAKYLADHVPDPPVSYAFTVDQKHEQKRFFREMKDTLLSSRSETNVDLFNATVVAVLPENCSDMLRQLILSLFITHAECNLNKTGRLVNDTMYQTYAVRGHWCANLVRQHCPASPSSVNQLDQNQ